MYKTLLQIVIFLILVFILLTIFYKYFYITADKNLEIKVSPDITINDQVKEDKVLNKKNENSVDSEIYNLSYEKFDLYNNIYLIQAQKGIVNNDTPNIILMYGVKASITYENNEKLLINCKRAVFNKVNFETKFFDNVEVIFQDQKLRSDSLDFLFDKNIAIFKDNVRYQNIDTKMFSDKITINIITKEIEITSKNKSDRIKVEKNN